MHICVHKLLQGTPQTIAMPSTATAGGGGSKKKKRKEKKQARLFSKVILPPCPECPKAPTSPHPDWIVRKLPKPECVKTPSGDLVWKFYCFYHHKTYKTKWFPLSAQVVTSTAAAITTPRFGGRLVRWQHLFCHHRELPSVSSPC